MGSAISQASGPVLVLLFISPGPQTGDLTAQAPVPASTEWDTMLSNCGVSNALWKAPAGTEDVPELLISFSSILKPREGKSLFQGNTAN